MSMSQSLTQSQMQVNGAILEKVITANDLAGLSSFEKVSHIKNVCQSLGLNPLTKPIQLIKFQGKEVMYVTKDATEQLRKNHHVSITKMDNKIMNGTYIATAYASTPDGRTDASTGAIVVEGLKGDALCNAIMKAETKAKRRVTLSICGLGFIDESELDTMKGSKKIELTEITEAVNEPKHESAQIEEIHDIENDINDMTWCDTVDTLKETYTKAYKFWAKAKNKENLEKLMKAKDKRLDELEKENTMGETIDQETGEIKQ